MEKLIIEQNFLLETYQPKDTTNFNNFLHSLEQINTYIKNEIKKEFLENSSIIANQHGHYALYSSQ